MDLQISPFPNQFLYTRSKPDEFEHSFATYFDTKASETNASPVDEAKADPYEKPDAELES